MSEEIQGWRDIIQQNGKRKRPQLTIPKSIADALDEELLNPLKRVPIIETFVFGFNFLNDDRRNSTKLSIKIIKNYIQRN